MKMVFMAHFMCECHDQYVQELFFIAQNIHLFGIQSIEFYENLQIIVVPIIIC